MSHLHHVKLLYRRILKQKLHWNVGRQDFIEDALATRYLFDQNKSLTDPGQVRAAVNRAEQWLAENQHPDPYCIPTQVGGSSFQRNAAPPLSVIPRPDLH